MNLSSLIANIQKQLKIAEKLVQERQKETEVSMAKQAESIRVLTQKLSSGVSVAATSAKVAAPKAVKASKGAISAAGRERIRAAQFKRWAKIRRAKGAKVAVKSVKVAAPKAAKAKKGAISAAGRERIRAAQFKRWAKVRRQNRK